MRDVVLVEGADARSYLQSQLTQDVEAIVVGGSAWSFILDPKSNIEALVRITRIGHDRLALDIESGFGDAVRRRLDDRLFRTDARFSQFEWRAIAWRGDGALARKTDAPILSRSTWTTIEGLDVVGPNVVVPADVDVGTDADFEGLRIEAGWPAMGAELGDGITPAMTGLVDTTVSFDKGCYTGQELVARTYHRGAAPTQRLVHLRSQEPLAVDTVTIDGEAVGRVTSASVSGVALAYLARRVGTPVQGVVAGTDVAIADIGSGDD